MLTLINIFLIIAVLIVGGILGLMVRSGRKKEKGWDNYENE